MSLDAHMNHTCIIQRDTVEAENPLGGPGTISTATVYEGICRLVEKQQRVYSNETAQWIVINVFKLFLPSTALVQDRDVIASITLENEVVLENAFVVKQALVRRSSAKRFISIDLERLNEQKAVQTQLEGDHVLKLSEKAMSDIMVEAALTTEAEAKKELIKGHGVETGTLRRSIHAASPDYTYGQDNVEPTEGSPERGGKTIKPQRVGDKLMVLVGSGLSYALAIHQGGHLATKGCAGRLLVITISPMVQKK